MPNIRSKRSYLLLPFLALLIPSCSSPAQEEPVETEVVEEAEPEPPKGQPFAIIQTSKGDITIELLPDVAPQHVENFISLAESGFYYKTLFHRIIPGTLIQGGDPNSRDNNPYNDGQGNSNRFVPAEFSDIKFMRGTVGMARQPGKNDSASCQFFITLERISGWDGEYTVFGTVVEGIEVVEAISKSPRSKDPRTKERPTARIVIKDVAIEYRE